MFKKKYSAPSLLAAVAVAAVIGCMVGQTGKKASDLTPALAQESGTAGADGQIIHDAEYYVLEAQNAEKWAADDKAVDEKLAAFRKKNGLS